MGLVATKAWIWYDQIIIRNPHQTLKLQCIRTMGLSKYRGYGIPLKWSLNHVENDWFNMIELSNLGYPDFEIGKFDSSVCSNVFFLDTYSPFKWPFEGYPPSRPAGPASSKVLCQWRCSSGFNWDTRMAFWPSWLVGVSAGKKHVFREFSDGLMIVQ